MIKNNELWANRRRGTRCWTRPLFVSPRAHWSLTGRRQVHLSVFRNPTGFGPSIRGLDGRVRRHAALFLCNGLWINQPLAITWAAWLLFFGAREAAETEQTANFGTRGVHRDGGLLSSEPVIARLRHGLVTLRVANLQCNSTT